MLTRNEVYFNNYEGFFSLNGVTNVLFFNFFSDAALTIYLAIIHLHELFLILDALINIQSTCPETDPKHK